MFERPRPPIFGVLFLSAVIGSMAWASSVEVEPVIESTAPVSPPAVERAVAGAEATRAAEFATRSIALD